MRESPVLGIGTFLIGALTFNLVSSTCQGSRCGVMCMRDVDDILPA